MDRRNFLQKSAAAGFLGLQILPSRVLGIGGVAPSEMLNVAIVGNGLISGGHRRYYALSPYARIAAVCDVKSDKLSSAAAEADSIQKKRSDIGFKSVDKYYSYNDLLSRDDIDIVCICTPDHWHVAIALKAIQAGKAVYVEKPMSLTVQEGRILSDAVKTAGGILQVGSQQRSEWAFRKAAELVRNGYIGRVHTINTKIGVFPPAPENLPEEPVPEGFDYDRWLGQTPWYPYNHMRVLGNYGGGWRCFYDYGGRKDGDWGAHHFDIIQWALGKDDNGPTDFYPADSDSSPYRHYRYSDGTTVFVNAPTPNNHMIQFIGDGGEVLVSRGARIESTPPKLADMALKSSDVRLQISDDHRLDFLKAVKYGHKNICPAEVGHRSATVCHLSAIAKRLNKHVKWNPETEEVVDNPEAAAMLSRPRRAPYYLGV